MFRFVQGQSRGFLVLLAVLAIAPVACSGNSGTATPGGSGSTLPSPASTENEGSPAATSSGGNAGGAGVAGAAAALSSLDSYKFSMTVAGDAVVSNLPTLPGAAISGNAPVTITGVEIVQPEKAADLTIASFHLIEVGGYDYFDTGSGGGFLKIQSSTSLADAFSPAEMFTSAISPSAASSYTDVGTETKNGVQAVHYQASSSALAELGSINGIPDAVWTADVWIAADGGYPVSMAIVATASDSSVPYEVQFDITNVNDAANKVTAPTNVTGE